LLVGNKQDLPNREVKMDRIEDFLSGRKDNSLYIETSALTGHNVEEAFRLLVQSISI
jgi:GTPase SAR1 family protein